MFIKLRRLVPFKIQDHYHRIPSSSIMGELPINEPGLEIEPEKRPSEGSRTLGRTPDGQEGTKKLAELFASLRRNQRHLEIIGPPLRD